MVPKKFLCVREKSKLETTLCIDHDHVANTIKEARDRQFCRTDF